MLGDAGRAPAQQRSREERRTEWLALQEMSGLCGRVSHIVHPNAPVPACALARIRATEALWLIEYDSTVANPTFGRAGLTEAISNNCVRAPMPPDFNAGPETTVKAA